MRFLIVGAGGIGCYYGARLQAAGHAVSYLARGQHLAAMQAHGLKVEHEDFNFREDVDALDVNRLLKVRSCDQYDVIVLTTKGGSTAPLLVELGAWLSTARTPVLSLQNGVDNELEIAAVVGQRRTVGGLAVRIGGHIVAPGEVEATGPAQVVMGAWPRSRSVDGEAVIAGISTEFNAAGIPARVSPDIQRELWRKLVLNNGVNPLSAVTGLDTRTLTSHPVLTRTVYRLMQEVAAVAKADGVELSGTDVDEMYELICTFDAIKTSMLVDKEKGRPLELDTICGAVLSRASRIGVAAPVTELVDALLRLPACMPSVPPPVLVASPT